MTFRRTVAAVALLNLLYFGVEFAVALASASVALFADSIDFLEDAAVNLLILLAIGWSAKQRAAVGALLALIILVPGFATLWTAWAELREPVAPSPVALAGLGALAVNLLCAGLLARHRGMGGSLTRAAFLSARNDAAANAAIIASGALTAWLASAWPDLIAGLAIATMNTDAAFEVYRMAAREWRQAGKAQA